MIERDFRTRLGNGFDPRAGSQLIAERAEDRANSRAWQRVRLGLIVVTGAACVLILVGVTHA